MKNILPEIIAVSVVALMNTECSLAYIWLLCLATAIWLRLIWSSVILIHELGHAIAISALDGQSTARIGEMLAGENILNLLRSHLPGSAIFIPGLSDDYPFIAAGNTNPWGIRVKAIAGISFNLVAAAIAFQVLCSSTLTPYLALLCQAFIISNLLIAACSWTDIYAVVTGVAENFYCGNFGFICKRKDDDGQELMSERMTNMYNLMGQETEIRGEQAGGGLVVAQQDEQIVFVGKKVVNRKRDNLTKSLETAFASVRRESQSNGVVPLQTPTVGMWHYRFGTSGPPAIIETHWHEWMEARTERVWDFDFINRRWICEVKNVNHRITHNGDFDAWTLYKKEVENQALGLWLERVLHTHNYALGDSPKIAGMMDFLITKGMWYASVRLAYHLEIADSIESSFDGQTPHRDAVNTAPTILELMNWARIFEYVFEKYCKELLGAPNSPSCNLYQSRMEDEILKKISNDNTVGQWNRHKRRDFVRIAVHAFFHNDANEAVKRFMEKAFGSFGLVVVSTLDKERLVLSAKGQPISIGFNKEDHYMVYASEPAAVDAVLLNLSKSYRLDLDQEGEIALVSFNEIDIYSLSKGEKLSAADLDERWISMKDHPYLSHVKYPKHNIRDPIASDNLQIPAVLEEIKLGWQNPNSLNCQTADYMVRLLYKKANDFELQRQTMLMKRLSKLSQELPTVDLLIIGVENSLWLGERFVQDLKTIFPKLNARSISSNQFLQDFQHDYSSLHLGGNSIILAITQSGQTYPTVQAINALDKLYRTKEIGELFILTGKLTSFLGSPVIKARNAGNEHHKVFVSGSGRRIAEPATLSVAATQQTLTELLLYLAKEIHKAFSATSTPVDLKPFGMTLAPESIDVLEKMNNDFVEIRTVQIMGATPTGTELDSSIKQELINSGRKWACHITEAPTAWAIHAVYIFISFGWIIPFGYAIPLATTIWKGIALLFSIPQDWFVFQLISSVVTLTDIGIYIFGAWLWTLGLRYFQGRTLLARIGKRTLVIGDAAPWVNQILENYVSKLFSLSYGIASLEVHSSNARDNLVHDYAHRVFRGTLLFLGVPDGRKSEKLKQQENAVILSGKQADGIRNFNVGPEVVVIGFNPKIADKGFTNTIILDSDDKNFHARDDSVYFSSKISEDQKAIINELRESRFSAFERLLASYVFFWALAKKVASYPVLNYQHWKSQSRSKSMTTPAPIPGPGNTSTPTPPKANQIKQSPTHPKGKQPPTNLDSIVLGNGDRNNDGPYQPPENSNHN